MRIPGGGRFATLLGRIGRPFQEGFLKRALRRFSIWLLGRCARELFIARGDTVVQVGTPNERTVRRLARSVGQDGRVVIVEAFPATAQRLEQFRQRHGFDQVKVVPKGAWSQPGTHELLVAPLDSDHRLEDPGIAHDNDFRDGGYPESVTVPVDTLDHILEELGVRDVDFVEITVNGAELRVLQGMKRSLDRVDRIFVKAHARDVRTGEPLTGDVADLLRSHGFRVYLGSRRASVSGEWGARDPDVFGWRG